MLSTRTRRKNEKDIMRLPLLLLFLLETSMATRILIIMAMKAEAQPFIDAMELKEISDYAPFTAYGDEDLTLVTAGQSSDGIDRVGTVPAALATFAALSKGKFDVIVNAGTCGGFQRMGAKIGSIFGVHSVQNHDRRIAIPGFTEYGIGNLKTPMGAHMAKALEYQSGMCTTGNSLDAADVDKEHFNDASVKDMEAAAIAYTAKEFFQTPYLGLKVVTDIVDGDQPTHEEFLQNLATASQSLQTALPQVIEWLQKQTEIKEEL